MNTITGHNDTTELNSVSHFLVPTWAELALLLLASILLVGLQNSQLLINSLTNGAAVSPDTFNEVFQAQRDAIDNFFQQSVFAQLAGLLVWGIIGSIVYGIIFVGQHTYSRTKEDIDESNNVQPVTAAKQYWQTKAAHYFFFICSWVVLSGFLILFFGTILPHTKQATSLANSSTALSVGVIMVSLYVLVRLWRAARYIFRITY